MHKLIKQSMLVFLALALVMVPLASSALAQGKMEYREPSAGAMTYDLFIMRPFGIAATVAGSAVFVVSLPFTLIAGNMSQAGEKLVVDPFNHSITRHLATINMRE